MVKIVTTIIPGEDEQERKQGELQFIDERLLDQPEFAMHLVMQEISHVNGKVAVMLQDTRKSVLYDDQAAMAVV